MNQRATVSVNSLIKALPFGAPDDLLLLSIFGSQVKGTERPDSDLDVLYVTRTSKVLPINTLRDAVTKTPGGVTGATVIPYGPDTITRTANVYGSVEYGVLREQGAKTLWRTVGFNVKLHADIDYDYSAGRWLDVTVHPPPTIRRHMRQPPEPSVRGHPWNHSEGSVDRRRLT